MLLISLYAEKYNDNKGVQFNMYTFDQPTFFHCSSSDNHLPIVGDFDGGQRNIIGTLFGLRLRCSVLWHIPPITIICMTCATVDLLLAQTTRDSLRCPCASICLWCLTPCHRFVVYHFSDYCWKIIISADREQPTICLPNKSHHLDLKKQILKKVPYCQIWNFLAFFMITEI